VKFRSESDVGGGSQSDIWIYGWLLVPRSVLEAKEKCGTVAPAIICLHSTTYGAGKSSPAGSLGRFASDPNLGFVGRPDLVGKDPRYNNDLPDPMADDAWSVIGKNIWDVMRSVDYLQTLPNVNPRQIGCTGWSHGGHTTLFAAAFDERIAAAVPNGGVIDWRRPTYPPGYGGKAKPSVWSRAPGTWEPWTVDGEERPSRGAAALRRWGFVQNSGPVISIPKFEKYVRPENRHLQLPVEFDSLMMMVAPRPLLMISSEIEFRQHTLLPKCMETMDVYAKWTDVKDSGLPSPLQARKQRAGYQETVDYYTRNNGHEPKGIDSYLGSLNAGDCFRWFSFLGGHSYPLAAQMLNAGWFGRWLGVYPAAAVPELPGIRAADALTIGPLWRGSPP